MTAARRGEAVLHLDDLWTDTAALAQFRAYIAQQPASPLADQIDAATREVLDALRRLPGEALTRARPRDVPAWLRLGLLDALIGFLTGTARTCLHQPAPARPEPVTATAWRPGVIACIRPQCTHLLTWPPGSVRDRICDGCGHICDGLPDDPIYPGIIAAGPLTYTYGVCSNCRTDLPEVDTCRPSVKQPGPGRRQAT